MPARGEASGMRLVPLLTASAVLAGMAALAPSAGAASGPAGSPRSDCRAHVAGLDLQTASFTDLEKAMVAGRLTSRQLTAAYLDRISAYNGPVNAIRALNPHALADAARLDAERKAGHVRGPLHGLPIVLKDNIGTTDMPTTAGSIALEGSVPKQDAFLTARLRKAGAVILGKTNLSEFANWVDLSMPNGYSSLGGQVKNAYTMGDPSGSSSGSGVGESMAFAAGAFGSETSGSILSPSDVNGLVGVKPTRGLVSRAGVSPLAQGFDTAGPMTRSVADAAALLTVVAGTDARDPATATASQHATDYVKAIRGASLKGVRLGYSSGSFPSTGARGKVFAQVLADLKRLGATLVDTDVVQDGGNAGLAELGLIPNDFKANLNHYLTTEISTPKSGVKSLADIIAFNDKHPDKVKYGQNLLKASDAMPGEANSASVGSLALRTVMGGVIDGALAKDSLDAILAPGASYANAGASAGYPTVIVPAGLVSEKSATGISFMGTAWSEAKLLRIAAAYEAGSHRRVPPTVVNEDLITRC
jgi:amidase